MKLIGRLAALVAVGVLTVAVPALAAKPPHPPHPAHPGHPGGPAPSTSTAPSTSHKCMPHNVAYVASGTIVTWGATQNADGTWSGPISVRVKRANHHAASSKGIAATFTLTNAKVHMSHGVTSPPAAGSRVQVMGKITALAKKCSQTGFTPTITIKRANVHTAHTA
jgi:hypothetical protein